MWRKGVTVCLAVGCDANGDVPKIVFVSDRELSLGTTTTSELKARYLALNWGVMFAGDDVTYAEDVIDEARILVAQNPPATAKRAANAMSQAYQKIRRERLEELYLGTYGWTMQEFVQQGSEVPSATHRQFLIDSFERYDLGCQFLVAGFSSLNAAHPTVFEVHNPGIYVNRSLIGYSAIGSGSVNAIAYLSRQNQEVADSLSVSTYNAIVAKRLAEKAPGVGSETVAFILARGQKSDHDIRWLGQEIEDITKIWLTEEADIRPRELNNRVSAILNPPTTMQLVPQKSGQGQ
jgi:hypothetical protein